MPESTPHESSIDSGAAATALADPPQPPSTPPGAVATGAPKPRRGRGPLIAAIVTALVALALIGVSIYLVLGSVSPRPADSAQARAEFDSAMRKAGVTATYPGNPVTLTDVVASGSHPFSATFTGDEIAVLMSTFPYESDVGGVRANLRNVGISVPEPGSVTITAIINANGGTYSGEIGMPLAFESGRVTTSGVSSLNVEGMPTTDAQKSMAGDAFTTYFNEYLKAAPGLSLDSAVITADGVVVSGTAPDSLTYP